MTGKWVQTIPDLFNPDFTQPIIIKEVNDIDKNPTNSDVDKYELRFDDEVSTSERLEKADEDFIMINGVKYIRSKPNGRMEEHSELNNIKKRY